MNGRPARTGAAACTQPHDPGRVGGDIRVYTCLHALIVAGIIICAVSDEVVLVHPDHAETGAMAVILGGPLCHIAGAALFKWSTNGRRAPPLSHLAGLQLLGLLAAAVPRLHLSPLATGLATTAVLAVMALWESLALRRGR